MEEMRWIPFEEGLPSGATWEISDALYLEIDTRKFKVKRVTLVANGTRDLLAVVDKNGDPKLRRKADIEPQDKIIHQFNDDIMICEFHDILPEPFNNNLLIQEQSDNSFPFMRKLIEVIGIGIDETITVNGVEHRGRILAYGTKLEILPNYDAHLGREFGVDMSAIKRRGRGARAL